MNWSEHYELKNKHAFLSPSNYAQWRKKEKAKLKENYISSKAKELGTKLHALASENIKFGLKASKAKKTIYLFINDCIGFNMRSEQPLYYSEYCFGTADAIKFQNNQLMIFDLKTGKSKASFEQLDIYAALFCLEHGVAPEGIDIIERIYQFNDFTENMPTSDYIREIMDDIVDKTEFLEEVDESNVDFWRI